MAAEADLITLDSVVHSSKDQVSCRLAGEAAILHLKKGIYYGLDPVGARIWDWIGEGASVRQILKCLLEEYEVEPGRGERDLLALLNQLQRLGLIRIQS